jgi:hypothetical protein
MVDFNKIYFVLFFVLVVLAVAKYVIDSKLRSFVKRGYPEIWDRMCDSVRLDSDRERERKTADWRDVSEALKKEPNGVRDPKLSNLLRMSKFATIGYFSYFVVMFLFFAVTLLRED